MRGDYNLKATPILTNFTSGEITPKLRGRVDVAKYFNGCEELTNMIVTPQGGAFKRPGTKYIATASSTSSKTRLVPFEYSVDIAYVLCLVKYGLVTSIFKARAKIDLANAIFTHFTEDELPEVEYTQSADILYLFHHAHQPIQIMRFSDTNWTIMPLLLRDGPYLDTNTTDVTITPSAAAGKRQVIKGMAYGATMYVVVGQNVTGANLHYSADAKIWTAVDLSLNYPLNNVHFANSLFVAVGGNGSIVTSANGVSWTSRAAPGSATNTMYDVCYDTGIGKWIAIGSAGVIWTSADAITWAAETSGVATDLYGVCAKGTNGSQVQVVGAGGVIRTSTDASTWTGRTSGTTENLRSVTLYDEVAYRYYAVGDNGTILTSTNGTTWAAISCAVTNQLNRVISFLTTQLAVGNDGILISLNGAAVSEYKRVDTTIDLYAALDTNVSVPFAGGTDGFIVQIYTTEWRFRLLNIVTQTLTASDDLFINERDTTYPRHIRVQGTTNWGWGTIISFTSSRAVTIDVREEIAGTAATTDWRLGAFYNNNFPACGQFYEQRLCLANAPSYPQTIWLSVSGDFTNFQPTELDGTVTDSMGMALTVASNTIEPILWMRGANVLLLGTPNGIWRLSGASSDSALSPTNITCKKQGTRGTASVPPQFVGPGSLYLQRLGRKIRELVYSYTDDAYLTPDMTILSEHITEDSIVDMTYQSEPFGILWCVRNDGYLLSMTYERDQQVVAWSKHSFIAGSGVIESVASIPGTYQDDLYLTMRATINGADVRHIMVLSSFDYDAAIADAFFVDDGITFSGTGTSITGLAHLEGETVEILGDGLVQATKKVTSGAVTAATAIVAKAQVGFPFTSVLQTVNLEAGARSGTSQGKIKRIIQAIVRFLETGNASMGYDSTRTDAISFTAGALTSGDKIINFPKGWNREAYVYIKSDDPLPCNVLCIIPEVETNER